MHAAGQQQHAAHAAAASYRALGVLAAQQTTKPHIINRSREAFTHQHKCSAHGLPGDQWLAALPRQEHMSQPTQLHVDMHEGRTDALIDAQAR